MSDNIVPNVVFILLIGILSAITTFIASKGSPFDDRRRGLKKLRKRGWYLVLAFFGILASLFFQELNNSNKEKRYQENLERESNHRDSIISAEVKKRGDSVISEILLKQKEGLGEIQLKVEEVNKLLGKTEGSLIRLGKSTLKKIETLSENSYQKDLYSIINLRIDYQIVQPNTIFEMVEVNNLAEKFTENLILSLEFSSIGSKYLSTDEPYIKILLYDIESEINKNSYTYFTNELWPVNGFNGILNVNHKMILHSLDGDFDNLKIGDTIFLQTNILWPRTNKTYEQNAKISFTDGTQLFCKFNFIDPVAYDNYGFTHIQLEVTKIEKP